MLRVRAEDGDKGNPRPIGYAILADSSPFAPFFSMDPHSGKSALNIHLINEVTTFTWYLSV